MHRKRKTAVMTAFFLAIFLTGCAGGQKKEETGQVREAEGRETASPEISHEIVDGEISGPEEEAKSAGSEVPAICVDRQGYITDGTKAAVFCGLELPAQFQVVNADSGESVFAGQIRNKGYDGEKQEYNGYGDFTEVQADGVYYIEAPGLGRSYSFVIGESLYEDVFQGLVERYRQRSRKDVPQKGEIVDAVGEMAVLLLAFELNGDSFACNEETAEGDREVPVLLAAVRCDVERLLAMQDEETGAVSASLTAKGPKEGEKADSGREEADPVSAAAFAMALARFSYLYQEYDTEFATECLRAADRAWMYAESGGVGEMDGWRFAAAAELYRASGRESFRDCVHQFLSQEDYQSRMDAGIVQGCVTYLMTRQPVELAFCEEITRALTARAEQVAGEAHSSSFLVGESGPDGDWRKLLEDGMYLCLVNHMVSSREYELAVENYLHYLMGRNRQSVSYLEAGEESGGMIFLLSEVLCWQKEHEEAAE